MLMLSACGTGRLVRGGQVNQSLLSGLEARLTAIRGLQFLRPVTVRAVTPAEVAATLDQEIAHDLPPPDMERLESVYTTLRLIAPGAALGSSMRKLLTTQLAAFYDTRTKTLAVSTEAVRSEEGIGLRILGAVSGRDPVGELVLSHELTHALQDQHWGIPSEVEAATDSHGDSLVARRALLEGDATWASFACVAGVTPDAATRARVLRQLRLLSQKLNAAYPDTPELLRDTLAFEYEAGAAFVDRLLAHGGWPAVDRAHADPPQSTEQVMHPERYLEHRDRPIDVKLSPTLLQRNGFTLVLADTLGELGVRTLASRYLPAQDAARVAAGWGGDRLAAFARGQETVIVWLTAWDTEADAMEFADALRVIQPDASVERRGTRVLVLLGPTPPGLAATVWRRSLVDGAAPDAFKGRRMRQRSPAGSAT